MSVIENPRLLKQKGAMEDRRIREKVTELLGTHPYLVLREISCDCQDGTLVLKGNLPSYFLKQVAQSIAMTAEGVREIYNAIEVLPSSAQ